MSDPPLPCDAAPRSALCAGVQKCLKYIRTNWAHYDYVSETPAAETMATFRKLRHDDRDWSAHVNF